MANNCPKDENASPAISGISVIPGLRHWASSQGEPGPKTVDLYTYKCIQGFAINIGCCRE